MMGSIASITRVDDQGVVQRPMPGDALGSALRDIYGEQPVPPEDMLRLLRMLDKPARRH